MRAIAVPSACIKYSWSIILGCTGNYPLISGLHFSVLDYQITSNSEATTNTDDCIPAIQFGENSGGCEYLNSSKGRIGADHYRGWCSENGSDTRPYLQVDFGREVVIQQVETQGLTIDGKPRFIETFWLAYSGDTDQSVFINVTELNSTTTKVRFYLFIWLYSLRLKVCRTCRCS